MLATLACRYLLKLPVSNFSGRSVRECHTHRLKVLRLLAPCMFIPFRNRNEGDGEDRQLQPKNV